MIGSAPPQAAPSKRGLGTRRQRRRTPTLGAVTPTTGFDGSRLAAVYDTLHGYAPGTQPDFYLGLARDLGAGTVVDIGCGTGLVTARFVRAGFDVVGLDPSEPMLRIARRRPGARGAASGWPARLRDPQPRRAGLGDLDAGGQPACGVRPRRRRDRDVDGGDRRR